MYGAIGDRLLDAAGTDAERWSIVLEHWPSFDPNWRAHAYEKLQAASPHFQEDQRLKFRETLRSFIAKHVGFPMAAWSLKGDELTPLKEIFDALEPSSTTARHAWLFGRANPRFDAELGWHERQERLEAEQIAAIEAISLSFRLLKWSILPFWSNVRTRWVSPLR